MDPEREDYADRDLPPPTDWSQVGQVLMIVLVIVLGVVGIAVYACRALSAWLGPHN